MDETSIAHAVSPASAGEESHLGEIRKHRDTVGALEQAVRDCLVALAAQIVQDLARVEQAPLFTCRLGVNGGGHGECDDSQQRND